MPEMLARGADSPKQRRRTFRFGALRGALLSAGEDGFAKFLAASFIAHSLFLAALALATSPRDDHATAAWKAETRLIGDIAADLAGKSSFKGSPAGEVTVEMVAGLLTRIYNRLEFSRDLTDRERSEIFRQLIDTENPAAAAVAVPLSDAELDSLIEAKIKEGLALSSGGIVELMPRPAGGRLPVRKLGAARAAEIGRRQQEEKAPAAVKTISDGQAVLVPVESGTMEVPAEYYFRSSPLRKMAALGADIFTIIRERGSAPGFMRGRSSPSAAAGTKALPPRLSGNGTALLVFLRAGGAPVPKLAAQRPRLRLSRPELERILDSLMALDTEGQLSAFKEDYLDRYDWDDGDLALLTREFLFNNMNGVFFILDDFAAAFDQAEELFFKRPVYDFFGGLAGRAPGTATDAEIRFYLAAGLDFELRTLERMLAVRKELDEVIEGRKRPASVFQPEAKALVLKRISDDFLGAAARLGLSAAEVLDWHVAQQQRILEGLAETGGETRNRALYAWGKLLWAQGEYEEAVRKWRQVDVSVPLRAYAYLSIMEIIDRYGLTDGVRKAVGEKLAQENASDRGFRLARHLKFHTWAKRGEPGRAQGPA
jgi:hypothetical protein